MKKSKYRRRTAKIKKSLEEARDILLAPYAEAFGCVDDPFTDCDKLHLAFAEGVREIWRMKVSKPLQLTGMWWTDGGEKKFTTRTIKGGRGEHLFIREDFREATIDVEVQVNVKVWHWKNKNKVKNLWLTCTLTDEQFKTQLLPFLGEREELCKTKTHRGIEEC